MVVLQNDAQVASDRATTLANGVSSLFSSGTVSKDGQSKIGGNDKAQIVIDASHEISRAIGQVIQQMSQNIHSVSSEFEAMDKQLGDQLQQLNQISSMRFSLNEPK